MDEEQNFDTNPVIEEEVQVNKTSIWIDFIFLFVLLCNLLLIIN